MSFSENTSDSDWKAARVKVARTIKQSVKREKGKEKRPSSGSAKPKYHQKFCDKWLKIFEPWLRRAAEDPNKPFCRACQCSMDCNRCHLVRHERTTKHKRNLESLLANGEKVVRRDLQVRQQRSKYYHQRKMSLQANRQEDGLPPEESQAPEAPPASPADLQPMINVAADCSSFRDLTTSTKLEVVPKQDLLSETETTKVTDAAASIPRRRGSIASNQEGVKLLMQIHQDKNELMESFRELMGCQPTVHLPPPQKEKNHVDLFFESVSSSVKALSPKLIAEAKMRVSQLICELELRGLKENSPTEEPAPRHNADNKPP
ncbi:hypothetical protein KR054_008824, partial [Drosophila jambulina]